jgi:diguanylate cyclase (GGDEF)-like protein
MLAGEYDVVLAEDGEAGWSRLASDDTIELLITDIQMPQLDGYGLICRVRADGKARISEIPIITITGAEDDETRIRAYACGSTDFIIKPFDKKLLRARVQAYLRLKQASLMHAGKGGGGADLVDPVTRLGTLGYFLQRGKEDYAKALQERRELSVAVLEVDDFDGFRKQHGLPAADALLAWLAKLVTGALRKDDAVARVGDAEIAISAPDTSQAGAMQICDRLRQQVEGEPFSHGASKLPVTISVGLVSTASDAQETYEKFLVLAEQRLSHAKSQGGNTVSVTQLSDFMPAPEEVVLTAVDVPTDSGPLALPEVEEISADAMDEIVRRQKTQPNSVGGPS